jgi:hypothetical protein
VGVFVTVERFNCCQFHRIAPPERYAEYYNSWSINLSKTIDKMCFSRSRRHFLRRQWIFFFSWWPQFGNMSSVHFLVSRGKCFLLFCRCCVLASGWPDWIIFAYLLGECLLWVVFFMKYKSRQHFWAMNILYIIVKIKRSFWQKTALATFWAIFWRTHLVTLSTLFSVGSVRQPTWRKKAC